MDHLAAIGRRRVTGIGIMQGRLVPPVGGRIQAFPSERWRDEFSLAADAGLQSIEWIYELSSADSNPLGSDEGIAEMSRLASATGVVVESLCADLLMEEPLVRVGENDRVARVKRFVSLLGRAGRAGMTRVVMPFVDPSAIVSDKDRDAAVASISDALPAAEKLGIELHLETSLEPQRFRKLLDLLPHPLVRVNYDSGNSASLGYDPREEFAAYGERIGSVHIKDRVRGGSTVPLGSGDADFEAVFGGLAALGYSGPWILQAARGESGEEVAWARQNASMVLDYLGARRQSRP